LKSQEKGDRFMSTQAIRPHIDLKSKRRYPRRHRKPRKEKTLTLAAGFPCRGGIILCADSEMTHDGTLKIPGNKILTHQYEGTSLAITGAGDWDYVELAFQKIKRKMEEPSQIDVTASDMQDLIEETITEIYQNNITMATDDVAFAIIAATRTPEDEKLTIFRSDQNPVVLQSTGFECCGSGAVLARYLADIFYGPDISTEQGIFLSTYILRLAKKYITGVGGRSDILRLTPDGEMRTQRQDLVGDLETLFSGIDEIIKPVLFSCPNIDSSEENFLKTMNNFNERIKAMREEFKNKHCLDIFDD
jgi:hypothetical protein